MKNKNTIVPNKRKDNLLTQVIPNFLSKAELFEIEKLFKHHSDTRIVIEQHGIEMGNPNDVRTSPLARAHYWYPGPSTENKIMSMLYEKLSHYFSREIRCIDWHILHSFRPYDIHSDARDINHPGTELPEGWEYAYTFLIPLEEYDSSTIIFDQESYTYKSGIRWFEHDKPELLDVIDNATYETYLSHCDRDTVRHLSVDTIFKWGKGDLLAASRHALHASDNYPANNILEKRALVAWTIKPKLVPYPEIKYKFNTPNEHDVECRGLKNLPWSGNAHQFTIQKDEITKDFPIWFAHRSMASLLNQTDFKTVLDIGCGEGLASNIFKFLGKKVTTIEPGNSLPRLPEFDPISIDHTEDYLSIKFEEKFDVIWCSHVVEHIRNPGVFLDKIFNNLNEGGTLALTVPYNEGNSIEWITDSHINKFSMGTMLYHLVSSGFDCRDIQINAEHHELSVILKKVSTGLSQTTTSHSFAEILKFFPIMDNLEFVYRNDGSCHAANFNCNSINWIYPVDYVPAEL